MTEIVIAVAAKVSEYCVAPIGRQLGYLFLYRTHTLELRNKVDNLGKAREDVGISVDEARRRGDEIRPIVLDWLDQVDQITGEAEELMKKQNQRCFNLNSRYQVGRDAYNKAQVIVEIQEARNFPDGVSYHVPPRAVTFRGYECFESRESTLNKIMEALRDDKTKMIGVWGMGGVGKTTMVKKVAEQDKQENLFTTQVYVQVSWTREADKFQQGISDIQQQIAGMLGLEFKNEAQSNKAAQLIQRLKKEKILIVLDDIWKEVNLEEVGIPSRDYMNDCKIVLASRDENLLRKDMGAQECFPIQHLQGEEAWHLFKQTAGDSVKGDELRPIAIKVVDECGGLPIAIVTIAKALKDESVAVWKNALEELRRSAPTNIRGVEEKVYTCLEWSYNHLKSDEAKSLFLLYGSLRYGGDILMDDLFRYAMGLDCFDHLNSLEQARNKLVTLVRTLKASSLLLDGEDREGFYIEASRLLFMDGDNKTIRMHDLVRDVARNIASKDPHRFVLREDVPLGDWSETHESKFILLNCKDVLELPQRLVCPKLQFFLLQNNLFGASLNVHIPNTFFEGMNQLKVLDLSRMSFQVLPSTLPSLVSLRTLRLDWCKLEDIAAVGQLQKLQILSMAGSNIQQLPKEMVQLTNLRLLDLNHCNELEVIPPSILSKLSRLECLFMKSSFSQWAAVEDVSDGDNNARLSELSNLDHLTTIEIEIPDVKMVPKEDKFFQNLTRFAIFIGDFPWNGGNYKTSKKLRLKGVDGRFLSRNGIDKLFKKTEVLELKELEEVCYFPIAMSYFDNLKTLDVEACHCLKILFSLFTIKSLPRLEEMTIQFCHGMQQIVAFESESEIIEDGHVGTNLQLLPKLQSLKLSYLSELVNFGPCSQGNLDIYFFSYQVSFSNLEKLELICLPKLKEIWHYRLTHDSLSNLTILRVETCPYLLNLIPQHVVQSFKNLKEIEVNDCKVLQHVFDLQASYDTNFQILPKLETLNLKNLVGLKGVICSIENYDNATGLFSCPVIHLSFHNLKYLSISYCGKEDKVKGSVNISTEDGVLFGEKVSFPNLEELILARLPMLKMIWHHQLSLDCFRKLRILRVCDCPCLISLIPSHLIQGFQNLEEIVVRDCNILEYVVNIGGLKEDDGLILPKIEILKLEELPRLRLIICNSNKNDKMRYSSSPSNFKDFDNLKELHIINCGMVLDDMISCSPNLEVLVLKRLLNWKEIDVGILQKLIVLQLEKLPMLSIIWKEDNDGIKRCLPSSSIFKNFYNMKELRIIDCPSIFKNFHNMKRLRIIEFGVEDFYTPKDVLYNNELPFLDGVCNYEAFESRAPTLNKIMDALRDDNINTIGVVGIGGVGKTTLVKRVALQAIEEKLFTRPVYIDASRTRESNDVQQEFAKMVGWGHEDIVELRMSETIETIRTDRLKRNLKKEKILIILDNIGKEIDLEKIGIPSFKDDGVKECKTVLICRDGDLLYKDIAAQVCFPVDTLQPEEAWALFKKTALGGDNSVVEENIPEELRSTALQVVKECEGLPMAIELIAKALKDETLEAVWKHALEHLKNCAIGKKVYSCVEWSYTHLKDDDVKSLLLLCSKLDYGDISMDHLLQYAIGVDLFGPIDSLEKARERLLASVEILKASSLLFSNVDNMFVRMHDVVYDVSREIASKNRHPFVDREDVGLEEWSETDESKRCTFLSLRCKTADELPQGLVCPELQFFILYDINPFFIIPNAFFEGMRKLQVLDLSQSGFTTLPSSVDSLENLRILRLDGCYNLVDIAHIGKLKKVEVLDLSGSGIQQLPHELGQLSNLRLLNLNNCWSLKVIPRNILSTLSRLECLFIMSSFTKWAVEVKSNANACLSELNQLSCLTTLYITIPDAKLLLKDIPLENLTRYAILMDYWPESLRTNRTLKLNKINRRLHLGDGISKLLERSEELEITGLSGTDYVIQPSNSESFIELKHLKVTQSPNIQYVIDAKDQQFLEHNAFPRLESLVVSRMDKLQEVWHGPIPIGSFRKLKFLDVEYCPTLRYLFLLSTARELSQLENIAVKYCYGMQQIVAYGAESEIKEDEYVRTNFELFPNLRALKLYSLPELVNFISEFETSSNARSEGSFSNHKISFSKLEELELDLLPNLKDIWHHQLPFGSNNLRTLRVGRCPCLPKLFPSNLIQSFENLNEVDVDDCEFLENFMNLQGIDGNVDALPKLQILKLRTYEAEMDGGILE